jgi:hypothetical protein
MSACNITGCDMPARWKVGVRVWAAGHSKATSAPADMHTTLVVCDHHKANPIHPAPQFFTPEGRAQIDESFRRSGRAVPDYEGAEWDFTPLELDS